MFHELLSLQQTGTEVVEASPQLQTH